MRDIVIEHPLRQLCMVSTLCIPNVAKWGDRRFEIAEAMNGLFETAPFVLVKGIDGRLLDLST